MRRLFLLVALPVLFAGCAATPNVADQQPLRGDLSQYRAVQVSVDAAPEVRQKDGYDVTADELRQQFIANVQARGKYASVGTAANATQALDTRLTITDLNYVSGAARAAAGIIAGRATLGVTMTVKDRQSGAVLGVVSASHASSHLQGVFSPTTSRQIEAIAKELASKL